MQEAHVTITPATDADRPWAASLMASQDPWTTLGVGYDACLRNCMDPGLDLYIAKVGADPCGILLIHPKGFAGSPYIKSIATDPAQRNTGAGLVMMHFAEERYGHMTGHLALCVSSFNSRAKLFYERLGYVQVGELKDYIMPGASEMLMVKKVR
jgi:[ribosomal protein S18]-alanine N-acetyltransferase